MLCLSAAPTPEPSYRSEWRDRQLRSSQGLPRGNSTVRHYGFSANSCYNCGGSRRVEELSMHFSPCKWRFLASIFTIFGLLFASATCAQDSYPNQNVRFVVAFPAGGPTDAVARILGQR